MEWLQGSGEAVGALECGLGCLAVVEEAGGEPSWSWWSALEWLEGVEGQACTLGLVGSMVDWVEGQAPPHPLLGPVASS